ncbi:MAG: hypothetical protein H5T42_00275 [Methanothrix sp.]|uniref:Lipoprotein n=2 Tax=Methanothrix TaxID=2222 RepID=A0B887_METTP|nr:MULTISPECIES: hypothetical protein [Methanothrix]ABK14911.1 hypothetical protein Mthe_1128 [Methanothrix thermoacetophila PT]MBC7078908.1 hypothetical protein [Methanothrix sp.]NPU87068.1 hypothetical protein [Methanothrix sp.]
MNRLTIIIAVFALLGCSAALDAKVIIPEERTLVVDPGEGYYINTGDIDTSSGIFMENFTIFGETGKADAVVFTPYDDILKMLSKESFLDIMSVALMIEATKEAQETGNWTTSSYYGAPVVVHNMTFTSGTLEGSDGYLAVWHAGGDSYIMLLSMLDSNTTSQIIRTARIV